MSWFSHSLEWLPGFLMSFCSNILAHTTEKTVVGLYSVVKVCWNPSISEGTEVQHHASLLLLQCFSVTTKKEAGIGEALLLFSEETETKWTRIQCGREVSGPGPKLQSPLAWLPHLAAEWQGVRCGHSRVKVCSGRTQIMKGASSWSLHCPACPSGSAAQLFGKNNPVRSTGSVNGYLPWVSLYQARPLNY